MVEIKNGQTPEEAVKGHAPKETEPAADAAEETMTDNAVEENAQSEDATEEETEQPAAEDKEQEAGTEEEAGNETAEKTEKEKKKAPRKKPKKDKRDEKIEELNDRLMRNLAEFENFRNRSEKEKAAMFDMGAKTVIEKILPVVDNLERGFDGLSEEEREEPFVKGIEAVYKQLQTAMEELGVTPIEAVGQEFDPNLHNAVMHDEDDSDESNKIIEEFQKGYMYKDAVVRHSMVKVLN